VRRSAEWKGEGICMLGRTAARPFRAENLSRGEECDVALVWK